MQGIPCCGDRAPHLGQLPACSPLSAAHTPLSARTHQCLTGALHFPCSRHLTAGGSCILQAQGWILHSRRVWAVQERETGRSAHGADEQCSGTPSSGHSPCATLRHVPIRETSQTASGVSRACSHTAGTPTPPAPTDINCSPLLGSVLLVRVC